MRIFLTISILFFSLHIVAQKAANINQPIYNTVTGNYWNCVVVNSNVASTGKQSAIIFFPGSGETGFDTSVLNNQGPLYHLNNGWQGAVTINGQTFYPRYYFVQSESSGGMAQNQLNRMIDTIKARYASVLDTNRLYVTGLSLGGGNATNAQSTSNFAKWWNWAACVGMSVTDLNIVSYITLQPAAVAGTGFYGLVGVNDDNRNAKTITPSIVDTFNIMRPGSAQYYGWTHDGGGHDGWNTEYDPNTRRINGENVYEWMHKHTKKPYAKAPDNFTTSGTSITLNGVVNEIAGGYNGRNRTITWSKLSGPSATISSPNADTTNVTGLTPGTYSFRLLSANAAGGQSAADTVTVIIEEGEASPAPTASAGSDQSTTNTSVTLSGSGTPGSGETITGYAWTKISGTGGTITSPTSASTTVTGLSVGTYVYRLTVTQSDSQTDTDDVTITITSTPVEEYIFRIKIGSRIRIIN